MKTAHCSTAIELDAAGLTPIHATEPVLLMDSCKVRGCGRDALCPCGPCGPHCRCPSIGGKPGPLKQRLARRAAMSYAAKVNGMIGGHDRLTEYAQLIRRERREGRMR